MSFAECHYPECPYAERRYAECPHSECHLQSVVGPYQILRILINSPVLATDNRMVIVKLNATGKELTYTAERKG